MLMLSASEQFKLDLVVKVLSGKMSRAQARRLLNVSKATFKRYIKAYQQRGAAFVKHGHCGRTPHNRLSLELKSQVKELIQKKYFDFNMTHLHERLQEDGFEVGRETLRKWCHELKMVKRSKRRRSTPRFYRDRMPQRGLMIQMDGSHHEWFGKKKSVLIAAIDDATSEIPYAEFFSSEDTFNCMKVVKNIVEKFGVFQVLYTDRAGIFGGGKRQNFAQLKRACEELGIQVVYAYSPEAKGRVERLFQTLQDRLCVEMRIRNITLFEHANAYLQNEFLPGLYADRFTVPPQNSQSAYQKLLPSIDLEQVFCLKEHRKIYNDHTISLDAKIYRFKPTDGISIAGHEVEIRTYPTRAKRAYYRGELMTLQKT